MTLSTLCVLAGAGLFAVRSASPPKGNSPVLVELFTSEGCSSCPPADRLLQQLDRTQPVPGAQIVVLSEHVDYWNQLGWKDPYSSHLLSERQNEYSDHFGLGSVYTPQVVVDGNTEFVGSDSARLSAACEQAGRMPKIAVRISSLAVSGGMIVAHVETGEIPTGLGQKKIDLYVAVALDHARSQVSRGENSGRVLTHVAVVQSLMKLATVKAGNSFAQDVNVKLPAGSDPSNLRLIAFVQQSGPGRVLGAAVERISVLSSDLR